MIDEKDVIGIPENEIPGDEIPGMDEPHKEEKKYKGHFITSRMVIGSMGMMISSIGKLTKEESFALQEVWMKPAVKDAEEMNLDDALAEVINFDNPYIALLFGFGGLFIGGLMTSKRIHQEMQSGKMPPKKEDDDVVRN